MTTMTPRERLAGWHAKEGKRTRPAVPPRNRPAGAPPGATARLLALRDADRPTLDRVLAGDPTLRLALAGYEKQRRADSARGEENDDA